MELICKISTKAFIQSLKIVCKAINKKNPVSALTNVLMKFYGKDLTLFGIQSEISLKTNINLENTSSVDMLVNGHLLLDILNRIDEPEINLFFTDKHFILETSKEKHNINRSTQFFPMEPWQFPENYMEFSVEKLSILLQYINIKTDNIKLVLKSNSFVAINFDRRRFSINQMEFHSDYEPFFTTVSRKTLVEILKLFPISSLIQIAYRNNSLLLRQENTEVLLKTIHDGQLFYERFMNLETYLSISVDSTLLRKAVEKVLTITDGLAKFVKLHFRSNDLTISGFDPNYGSSQSIVNINSPVDITLSLNGDYLLESLQCFNGLITLNICDSSKPFIITYNNSFHVIMPIRQ